jgi:DNA repair exonuclease SbcCD ATPase subunit
MGKKEQKFVDGFVKAMKEVSDGFAELRKPKSDAEAVDYIAGTVNDDAAEEYARGMDEIASEMSSRISDIEIFEQARQALGRVKERRDFQDWLIIGEACLRARQKALEITGESAPHGGRYVRVFSDILRQEKLDFDSRATRADLLHIMDNLSHVTEWLAQLDPGESVKLNHPEHVWRRYSSRLLKRSKKRLESAQQLRQELELAKEECEKLQSRNNEVEEKLATAHTEYKAMVDQRDERIAELEATIKRHEQTIDKLKARIAQLEGRASPSKLRVVKGGRR